MLELQQAARETQRQVQRITLDDGGIEFIERYGIGLESGQCAHQQILRSRPVRNMPQQIARIDFGLRRTAQIAQQEPEVINGIRITRGTADGGSKAVQRVERTLQLTEDDGTAGV